MANLTKPIDPVTRHAEFAIDSASEISLLPTTTKGGSGNLSTIENGVAAGSTAYTTDGNLDIYVLNGLSDEWKLS